MRTVDIYTCCISYLEGHRQVEIKQHNYHNLRKNTSLHVNLGFGFMVFNATFSNIQVISWRSILLMEESGENHRPVVSQ
jgi:hypothetical protein